jgi:hypothetical protein
MTQTAFILERQLEAANKDIAVLRLLVNHTVAIITAAGGRVEIPAEKHEEWSKREWRHENDGVKHIFTTSAPD